MDQIRLTGIFSLSNTLRDVYETPAIIIGAGALGTAVALQLAKIGVSFVVADDDVVEPHNLPNQCLYGPADVGFNKAVSLTARIRELTDTNVGGIPRRVQNGRFTDIPYIFVCVDNMATRKMIGEQYVPMERGCVIDGRMGARDAQSYLIDREEEWHRERYLGNLFDDADANVERAACGTTLSVGATAQIVASQMIWQFMDFVMGRPVPNVVATQVGGRWGMDTIKWQR